MLTAIEIATESIKEHEGYRYLPYDDKTGAIAKGLHGHISIGWGHNLEAKGISNAVARLMLQEDVMDAYNAAMGVWGNVTTWGELSEVRKAVLIEMAFQMGRLGLVRFENFLKHAKAGEWIDARDEMLMSKWGAPESPTHGRALTLATRFLADTHPY